MNRCDMFLKVDGVTGESKVAEHKGEIDLDGWGWGMSTPSAVGGNQSSGRKLMKPLYVLKRADTASTALLSVMKNNETKSMTVTVRKGGGSALPYFVVMLKEARIIEYTIDSGLSPEGAPVLNERLTIAFQTINVEYTQQSSTGAGEGSSEFESSVTSI